jgi:hypothetical protein
MKATHPRKWIHLHGEHKLSSYVQGQFDCQIRDQSDEFSSTHRHRGVYQHNRRDDVSTLM